MSFQLETVLNALHAKQIHPQLDLWPKFDVSISNGLKTKEIKSKKLLRKLIKLLILMMFYLHQLDHHHYTWPYTCLWCTDSTDVCCLKNCCILPNMCYVFSMLSCLCIAISLSRDSVDKRLERYLSCKLPDSLQITTLSKSLNSGCIIIIYTICWLFTGPL